MTPELRERLGRVVVGAYVEARDLARTSGWPDDVWAFTAEAVARVCFEEAAKVAEDAPQVEPTVRDNWCRRDIAAAIRALKGGAA